MQESGGKESGLSVTLKTYMKFQKIFIDNNKKNKNSSLELKLPKGSSCFDYKIVTKKVKKVNEILIG